EHCSIGVDHDQIAVPRAGDVDWGAADHRLRVCARIELVRCIPGHLDLWMVGGTSELLLNDDEGSKGGHRDEAAHQNPQGQRSPRLHSEMNARAPPWLHPLQELACRGAAAPGARCLRLRRARPVLVIIEAKASATRVSSRWSAAPRAGFNRQPSFHAIRSGSRTRATSPLMAAYTRPSTSAMLPENTTGGQSLFLTSSSLRPASTAATVAAPQGAMPTVTYSSVTRPASNKGRGATARTPAAVQSRKSSSGAAGSSPPSSQTRSCSRRRTLPFRTTRRIVPSDSSSPRLMVAPRKRSGSTVRSILTKTPRSSNRWAKSPPSSASAAASIQCACI